MRGRRELGRRKLRKRWRELLGGHRCNFVKDGIKSLFCHCGERVPRTRGFSAGRKLCFSVGQRPQSGRILSVFANARREHNENAKWKISHHPVIAERDFPCEFPSFVASVAANYKRILFSMSHFPTRYKKLISLSEQFRFISIVLGKSSGTSCIRCMHI